ncbi:hypothetical protein [Candidatus Erwinia haradaeae]|uniref:hypothetical protein n=1 Tax=Candidatus Erwinia haradaeae TaxID=1922217 RepID=UPI0013004FC9|nr:hypothetical protein [Candidatus Erwinia haradaeae]
MLAFIRPVSFLNTFLNDLQIPDNEVCRDHPIQGLCIWESESFISLSPSTCSL